MRTACAKVKLSGEAPGDWPTAGRGKLKIARTIRAQTERIIRRPQDLFPKLLSVEEGGTSKAGNYESHYPAEPMCLRLAGLQVRLQFPPITGINAIYGER
jgi:hypothetical protein